MLVMNKKIFGRTQKFSEKKFKIYVKIFKWKKSTAAQKNYQPKIFSFVKYLRWFGKNENLRNEESESLLVTKIIVCQFHEHERSCFSEGHRTWPQNGYGKNETVFEELHCIVGLADMQTELRKL